jgi:hypothetical protein
VVDVGDDRKVADVGRIVSGSGGGTVIHGSEDSCRPF